MGRETDSQPVRIVYIGRVDSAHVKHWEQLARDGFSVTFSETQKNGLQIAVDTQPQVIVINVPKGRGSLERLCRTLGKRAPNSHRLLLVDQNSHPSDQECECALLRPFTFRKLRENLAKMLESSQSNYIRCGELELDMIGRIVSGPRGQHHLTPKERTLLATFMERPNQVISRKALMEMIWDTEYLGDTRTLDVHIRWIREKIERDPHNPALLLTRRGIGYVLFMGETPPV